MNRIIFSAFIASAASLVSIAASAAPAEPRISVSAPNAQALVVSVGKAHPEASLIGLHADVPGSKNAIVACTDPGRVGKVSSAHDMSIIGRPALVVARLDKKHVYEAMLPVNDSTGHAVGMMVEQIPLTSASGEADALAKAMTARADIEKGISNASWLFAGS